MENKEFKYFDSSHQAHEAILTEDSFKLKNVDKKIHDTKFKGKPTTFLKDAVKRFAKNKSSVTAFVILGIMILLAVILPFAMPFSTTSPNVSENYLPPKLFSAGSGFWDGTKMYEDITYDSSTGLPAGTSYQSDAIIEGTLKTYDKVIDERTDIYGNGGYIRVATNKNSDYTFTANSFSLDASKKITIEYDIEKDILTTYHETPYYIALSFTDNNESQLIYLVQDSTEFGSSLGSNIDVSNILTTAGYTTIDDVSVRIGINGTDDENTALGIFIKSFNMYSDETLIENASFSDANDAIYNGSWKCTVAALSNICQVNMTLCSFRYDLYKVVYGNVENVTISNTDLQTYIDNGWMEYTYSKDENGNPIEGGGPSSFKILSDKCPIVEITGDKVENNPLFGIVTKEVTATVSKYKQLGYSSMPIHLFGTDKVGRDMFQYVFEGLRNSLGLGILVSAICFIVGLIYGAIEGYFGGNVDIVMERIVDILGNIPSVVIITLCVLHLGQGFGTFILAMCLYGWIGTASITRTQFYRFKRREYVLAARSLGASDTRLITKHILPNSLGTIVTSSVLMIPSVIFSEASVSYLGIGLQGVASLGSILSNNQSEIYSNSYLLLFPSILMAILMICFNLFGNGLRDALNPSLKGAD